MDLLVLHDLRGNPTVFNRSLFVEAFVCQRGITHVRFSRYTTPTGTRSYADGAEILREVKESVAEIYGQLVAPNPLPENVRCQS